jgi:hypothetical protein
MTDWVEPWSWVKNEVITASKLNTIRQAILYLKETTDDYHRTARPIDHPDGSITPVKLDALNTPSDGQAPVYDGETGRFRWATGMGGVSRLSELIIDVDKDWAGKVIKNLGEPVDPGDALRLPWNHASRHLPGGGDPLSGLSRSQLSDFWDSPFWANIPDKPSSYPPLPHASTHASGGSDALSGLSRSQVSDFFSSPFWDNIPDKPSAFPPSAHAPTHQTGGSDPITSLDAGVITSGTLGLDRIPSIPPSKLDAMDNPADGEVPSYNAAQGRFEWITPAGGAADYPRKLKPNLTRYVMPGWYAGAVALITVTAGRIYYAPIFVTEQTTYDRICVYVNTAATGTADPRVFAWNNGVPGSLILSAGTVDTSTTGPKELTINLTLSRGYYFLAVRCTGTPTLLGPDTAYAVVPPVPGFRANSYTNPNLVVLYADAEYSDPAPAPTGGLDARYSFVYLREAS